jgi:hypothetical protein
VVVATGVGLPPGSTASRKWSYVDSARGIIITPTLAGQPPSPEAKIST